jgi:hypothetical protein
MLSRGRASGAMVGSRNAVWAIQRRGRRRHRHGLAYGVGKRTEQWHLRQVQSLGVMDIRSVHHVASLEAARAFLKSEDWHLNVASIAEAPAQWWRAVPA